MLVYAIRKVHKDGSATFFVFILKDVRSFRWRRFKQRKREGERDEHPTRFVFSQVMPSLMHPLTLPRYPLSPRDVSLSLSFFIFLRMLHLSQLSSSFSTSLSLPPFPHSSLLRASPLCRYFPIDWSARRHPFRRSVRFSFISLFLPFEPFFIRRTNPSSPLPRWPLLLSLCVSLFSSDFSHRLYST